MPYVIDVFRLLCYATQTVQRVSAYCDAVDTSFQFNMNKSFSKDFSTYVRKLNCAGKINCKGSKILF